MALSPTEAREPRARLPVVNWRAAIVRVEADTTRLNLCVHCSVIATRLGDIMEKDSSKSSIQPHWPGSSRWTRYGHGGFSKNTVVRRRRDDDREHLLCSIGRQVASLLLLFPWLLPPVSLFCFLLFLCCMVYYNCVHSARAQENAIGQNEGRIVF